MPTQGWIQLAIYLTERYSGKENAFFFQCCKVNRHYLKR